MNEAQQRFYKGSAAYLENLRDRASGDYQVYADLVAGSAGPRGLVLDLGAGRGVSSRVLASRNLTVIGLDLSTMFLLDGVRSEGRSGGFVAANAMQLPFRSASFDVVGSFELIEHIPDVDRFLQEAARVLRPGGSLITVGPNLLSPLAPLRVFFAMAKRLVISGRVLVASARNLFVTVDKCFMDGWDFLYRHVVVREDMGGSDEDACYLSSPIDLRRWFGRAGFEVIRYQMDGRTWRGRWLNRFLGSFGPSLWVVSRKPEVSSVQPAHASAVGRAQAER